LLFTQERRNIVVPRIFDTKKAKALEGSPLSAFANGNFIYDFKESVKKNFLTQPVLVDRARELYVKQTANCDVTKYVCCRYFNYRCAKQTKKRLFRL